MIYQWTVFDTDNGEFEYFISKDKAEADRKAWKCYCDWVEWAEEIGCIEYSSADDFEDFVGGSAQYIDTNGYGSKEFGYIEFEV